MNRQRLTNKRVQGMLRLSKLVKRADLNGRARPNLFNQWSAAEKAEIRTALEWIEHEARRRGLLPGDSK